MKTINFTNKKKLNYLQPQIRMNLQNTIKVQLSLVQNTKEILI